MHRYFVTGSDTDVGKTRVAAALALALRRAGRTPTIVKLVQTGTAAGIEHDAPRAGRLAGVAHAEFARFERPADPWSAALAHGATLRAEQLAAKLDSLEGPIVVEGTGGMMVPLNEREHLGDVIALAKLETIVAVGLRLGCINHTLLTLHLCSALRIPVTGGVLVERWSRTELEYRNDVARALQGKLRIFGILPFAPAEQESVEAGAKLFEPLVN
jgi:dethiobiotin synthase